MKKNKFHDDIAFIAKINLKENRVFPSITESHPFFISMLCWLFLYNWLQPNTVNYDSAAEGANPAAAERKVSNLSAQDVESQRSVEIASPSPKII